MIKVTPAAIPEVLILEPKVFTDTRGFFLESYNRRSFEEATGIDAEFVQDNQSFSVRNVLRGLHYQIRQPQGKLVQVMVGDIYDVAVDLRRRSPTFGKWIGRELSAENHLALWVPAGFAHGFLALPGNEDVYVYYKCTEHHVPEAERAINYADPAVGISWPLEPALISAKDVEAPMLADGEYNFA